MRTQTRHSGWLPREGAREFFGSAAYFMGGESSVCRWQIPEDINGTCRTLPRIASVSGSRAAVQPRLRKVLTQEEPGERGARTGHGIRIYLGKNNGISRVIEMRGPGGGPFFAFEGTSRYPFAIIYYLMMSDARRKWMRHRYRSLAQEFRLAELSIFLLRPSVIGRDDR